MQTQSQSEADAVAAAGFEKVYAPVKPYLSDLDVFLQAQVNLLEEEIREQVRYVLGHSGKRLRPVLVAYSGWEGPAENRHADLVSLGAVIELVHLATLVHDDILDGAEVRHRQETAATRYGANAAVLVGDVLFSHALRLAAGFETPEVCRVVATATARVCAGEISQTYRRGEVDADQRHYFRVIELKTAELFDVSCRLGAAIAGYPEVFSRAAGAFGRHLGTAYQLFDDLVDLYGTESAIGKTLGTDLAKGKFTLPLLLLLDKLPRGERESLLASFRQGDPAISGFVESRLRDYPILEEVTDRIERELTYADAALADFASYAPIPHLRGLARFVRTQVEELH